MRKTNCRWIAAFSLLSASAVASDSTTGVVVAPEDDGVQRQRAGSTNVYRAKTFQRYLKLDSRERSLVGLTLTFPEEEAFVSRGTALTLPLYRGPSQTVKASLKFQYLGVNLPGFSDRTAGSISGGIDAGVPAIETSTYVEPTDTHIVLNDVLTPFVDIALADPAWIPGASNSISIAVSRTDASTTKLRLTANDNGTDTAELLVGKYLAGPTSLVCIGDSNTDRYTYGNPPLIVDWCTRLSQNSALQISVKNLAQAGSTVIDLPSSTYGDASRQLSTLYSTYGQQPGNAMIAAFGTNDINILSPTPAAIADAYEVVRQSALSHGMKFFVALTPPMCGGLRTKNPKVQALNAELASRFPAGEIIDFYSGFDCATHYWDAVHFNHLGHALRTQRAREALGR